MIFVGVKRNLELPERRLLEGCRSRRRACRRGRRDGAVGGENRFCGLNGGVHCFPHGVDAHRHNGPRAPSAIAEATTTSAKEATCGRTPLMIRPDGSGGSLPDRLEPRTRSRIVSAMSANPSAKPDLAVTPSRRTRHAELLRLCARIGYSPASPSVNRILAVAGAK